MANSKKKYKPEGPKSPGIEDPYRIYNRVKVDGSYYLGLIMHNASRLGIYKNRDPDSYFSSIDQIETFCIGSYLLGKDYKEEKKELMDEREQKMLEQTKKANLRNTKSSINKGVSDRMFQINIEFHTKWHKLLMKHLADTMWEKEQDIVF